jgi:hypothetical protein
MTGIWQSISTRSKACSRTISTAAAPLTARLTDGPSLSIIAVATLWLMALFSTSNMWPFSLVTTRVRDRGAVGNPDGVSASMPVTACRRSARRTGLLTQWLTEQIEYSWNEE